MVSKMQKTIIMVFIALVVMIVIFWRAHAETSKSSSLRAYYQLANLSSSEKPLAARWGMLNHTLIITSNNTLRSIITIAIISEPRFPDVRIELLLGRYKDYLAPIVTSGNLQLSRKVKIGDIFFLVNDLKIASDGIYLVGSKAVSYGNKMEEGTGTTYYVFAQNGRILKITDSKGNIPSEVRTSTVKIKDQAQR